MLVFGGVYAQIFNDEAFFTISGLRSEHLTVPLFSSYGVVSHLLPQKKQLEGFCSRKLPRVFQVSCKEHLTGISSRDVQFLTSEKPKKILKLLVTHLDLFELMASSGKKQN